MYLSKTENYPNIFTKILLMAARVSSVKVFLCSTTVLVFTMYTLRFLNIALSVGQVTLERAKILSPIVLATCEKKMCKSKCENNREECEQGKR